MMSHRQDLIDQVKQHYAQLAAVGSRQTYTAAQFDGMTCEAYYEKLLQQVIEAIQSGAYDSFSSGLDIVENIANTK